MSSRTTARTPTPRTERRRSAIPDRDAPVVAAANRMRPDLLERSDAATRQRTVRQMQAAVGNAAVAMVLQRVGGWPNASTKGRAWNDKEPKEIGRIWRLAIAGLAGGATEEFKDAESAHTTEGAAHRAVVLVPKGFKPKRPTDVLLHFHGHTETWRGKYAGMRQRSFKPTKATGKAKLTSDNKVRDVDLDQIEQQMDSSGKGQTIGILAQGGPQHQFGKINVDSYIRDVLSRTATEYPAQLTGVPDSWSVILSGHSGGGFAVRDALTAENKPENLKGLILFDAEAMQIDMRNRIRADLKFLADPANQDADRDAYLAARPSVRAFTSAGSTYAGRYQDIVTATITTMTNQLFPRARRTELERLRARESNQPLTDPEQMRLTELRRKRQPTPQERTERAGLSRRQASRPLSDAERKRAEALTEQESQLLAVTRYLPRIQTIYQLTALPAGVTHEEIIRGTPEGSGDYQPGQGNLEQALRSLP